jgi:hypothetical protein
MSTELTPVVEQRLGAMISAAVRVLEEWDVHCIPTLGAVHA